MKSLGIIPARYASTRFPGKPLIDIHGKSMVQRVFEQAKKADLLDEVVVATDDQRILDHVLGFGGKAVMTSSNHPSGTDRCNEALSLMNADFDVVVNIQGDEPFIDPAQIDLLIGRFQNESTQIATLVKAVDSAAELQDPNKVKAVLAANGKALYFSRQALPYGRDIAPQKWHEQLPCYLHIGIYAYRSAVLKAITQLSQSPLEKAEALEQLRWLENSFSIDACITEGENIAVDTPEDLERILRRKP